MAAAAAKSLQSCPTLCDPTDGSPPASPSLGFFRLLHPWDSPGKNTGMGYSVMGSGAVGTGVSAVDMGRDCALSGGASQGQEPGLRLGLLGAGLPA